MAPGVPACPRGAGELASTAPAACNYVALLAALFLVIGVSLSARPLLTVVVAAEPAVEADDDDTDEQPATEMSETVVMPAEVDDFDADEVAAQPMMVTQFSNQKVLGLLDDTSQFDQALAMASIDALQRNPFVNGQPWMNQGGQPMPEESKDIDREAARQACRQALGKIREHDVEFVRRICRLTPEQFAAVDAACGRTVDAMVESFCKYLELPARKRVNPVQISTLREALVNVLEEQLSAEQTAALVNELSARYGREKEAVILQLADTMDELLLLNPGQRDKLETFLTLKYRDRWRRLLTPNAGDNSQMVKILTMVRSNGLKLSDEQLGVLDEMIGQWAQGVRQRGGGFF